MPIVTCRGLTPGIAVALLAVSSKPLVIGRIDTHSGRLNDVGHPLHGRDLAGAIVCAPSAQGSSSGSYVMLNLASRGLSPAGLVLCVPDAVSIAGAVLARIPMATGLSHDELASLEDAKPYHLNGSTGELHSCT